MKRYFNDNLYLSISTKLYLLMQLRFIRLCILLSLAFVSCNKKESVSLPYYIDINQNLTTKEIMLSEFIDDIDYVILENKGDHFIKWAFDLRADSKHIAVRDLDKILLYNWNGKLICSIDNKGRGPGEYNSISAMELGNDGKSVLIFSGRAKYSYSISDGSFIGKTELPGYVYECRSLDSNHYYLGIPAIWGDSRPAHIVVNNEFDTLITVLNKFIFSSEIKFGTNNEVGSYRTMNGCFFKEFMDDTLFSVSSENGIKPYAIFNSGKDRFTTEKRTINVESNFFESIVTGGFFEAGSYLFTWLSQKEESRLIAYNKETKLASKSTDWSINDVDGGIALKYPFICNDTILVASAPASEIISYKLPEEYSDPGNKFQKLQSIIEENDNHVLIIYRLKK